ncbi:MAG: hypothetical protein N2C14_03860, partial [Planctomycetales bacterium]
WQGIAPRQGRDVGRAVWPVLDGKHPLLGPLVTRGTRLWAFHAELATPQTREIAELIPQGDVLPGREGLPERDGLSLAAAWRNTPDAALSQAVNAVLPGWSLLNGSHDASSGVQAELHDEQQVLATMSHPDNPVQFGRLLSLEPERRASLKLRVAQHGDRTWTLSVMVNNNRLSETRMVRIPDKPWRTVEVDLTKYAGQTVRVLIEQHSPSATRALWKNVEVVTP